MRILTVDDSRAIRNIVSRQAQEMGLEVDEAEHGEEGLGRLEECTYDLVVLDVTMPVLDGPGMLKKMREGGNQTPVLMLTSESKSAIVGECLKLGISDYILKPFKNEELKKKIAKALKMDGVPAAVPAGGAAPVEASRPAPVAAPAPAGIPDTGARQFIDVLVIDDMENVHKKLRSLMPEKLTLNASVSAQSAIGMARERIYRVILIDVDIPDVDSTSLLNQLRTLQPHAAFAALSLRTANDAAGECKKLGFDDVLFKPFDKTAVDDLLLRYFDDQEILQAQDNILRVGAFTGREDRLDRYYARLEKMSGGAFEKLAAACYEDAVIDLAQLPLRPERLPKLVRHMAEQADKFGITLRLVGPPEAANILKGFSETSKVLFYSSLDQARNAA